MLKSSDQFFTIMFVCYHFILQLAHSLFLLCFLLLQYCLEELQFEVLNPFIGCF